MAVEKEKKLTKKERERLERKKIKINRHRQKVKDINKLMKKYGIKYGDVVFPEGLNTEEKIEFRRKWQKRKIRYVEQRVREIRERERNGDTGEWFSIYLTLNKKKLRHVFYCKYRMNAIEQYEKMVEENHTTVKFPKKYAKFNNDEKIVYEERHFEILLVKKSSYENNRVGKFRNKHGVFVETEVCDSPFEIIRKDDWYVEETFHICGHSPFNDRKDFNYIIENFFSDVPNRETSRNVFTCQKTVFVQYDEDITFFGCRTVQQANELYEALRKHVGSNKYVLFSGTLNKRLIPQLQKTLIEKTGMAEKACKMLFMKHHVDII